MTASLKSFNLHALAIEELEQRILKDVREHNFPGLPPLIEALFFKSLDTRMDSRRMGMEAFLSEEAGKALQACLTAFSESNPQQGLTLLTTLMTNLRGHYDQSHSIDTDPARAFLEENMVPLLCDTSIQPPVRARASAALFSGQSFTPERPSYLQAISAAANILNEEKTHRWMFYSELSDHCVTIMNAASYYHDSDPEDAAEEANQRILAPIYAAALETWKDVLQKMPVEKAIEQAQLDRFKYPTPELEDTCNAVGGKYVLAHPDRLESQDFVQAVSREVR